MGFLGVFMTGIGLSMDAVAVSIAKGMTLKGKLLKNAVKIALFFGIFQALMPLIGWWAGRYFEEDIKVFDHWIAFILLGAIGGKMIFESVKGMKERRNSGSKNEIQQQVEKEVSLDIISNEEVEIRSKDLIILAIATSIDALAIGVSFAFLNIKIIPSVIIIGLTTFVLCILAVLIGKKLGSVLQKYAELVGGSILIIIGLNILIEHIHM